MNAGRVFSCIGLVLFFAIPPTLSAQDHARSCPVLVEEALNQVNEACNALGRNQACYGNFMVTAQDWNRATLVDFESSGDRSPIETIAALTTLPLNPEAGTWGIALLALQADLPATVPGQNVTFVLYGDATLQGLVPSDDADMEPVIYSATANDGANVRTGPGTGYAVAGGLTAGDEVTVIGRNGAGDWLHIQSDELTAWVFASLVSVDGDISALSVGTGDESALVVDDRYRAPMQAFRFSTGIGKPACEEAPRDGMLIQAPQDTTVHFLINGIEVEIGSTALLQIKADTLGVNVLDGLVSVTSAEETRMTGPGTRIDVVAGEIPVDPVIYNAVDVANTPVGLLPEAVDIPQPPPAGSQVSIVGCVFGNEGKATSPAGQPIILRLGWADYTAELVNDYVDAATIHLTANGQPVELWSVIGPFQYQREEDLAFRADWYWVIPDPAPGVYETQVIPQLSRTVVDGDGNEHTKQESYACKVTVQ